MAKQLVKWLKKTVSDVLDPDQAERVRQLASFLYQELRKKRREFNILEFQASADVSDQDLAEAKESVLCRVLDKVWEDGVLNEKERKNVSWIENALGLTRHETVGIHNRYASWEFKVSLAAAMEDGVLTNEEIAHLEHIAESVGETTASYARAFFRTEGEEFIHGLFRACIEDGEFSSDDWASLVSASRNLGLQDNELRNLVAEPLRKFVEHVLADAKADDQISDSEREELLRLLKILDPKVSDSFTTYVLDEIALVQDLAKIRQGKLPSVDPPEGLEIRAGEIVHLWSYVILYVVRNLKAGSKLDTYVGRMTLLDSRAIFESAEKSEVLRYRRIVYLAEGDVNEIDKKFDPERNLDREPLDDDLAMAINVQLEGKPRWHIGLSYGDDDWRLFYPIFRQAVAMANQTVVKEADEARSRHIRRDVRQRVWQKYGGKCVECSASQYLEFDHIIPVAKGGSNGDSNIQLLCRQCNLKKSDHI